LTVTDPAGKTGTTVVPFTVGNTAPTMTFNWQPNGAFFDFGDEVSWDLTVTDPENDVDDDDIIVQPALGHDDHAHPADEYSGATGTVQTSLGGGHSEDMKVFYALDARYTDEGANGQPPL